MILSASRRTDIPAFYPDWLMARLQAGTVSVRNPMNHGQVRQIPLSPESVDCIVFWTKDPAPLLSHLPELDAMGYRYYFQFTLTPYGPELERYLREKAAIAETFISLAKHVGKDRMIWRYDPIILNRDWDVPRHTEAFTSLCEKLHPHARSVTVSFVDQYPKLKTDLVREVTEAEMLELGGRLAETAKNYGLAVNACCEEDLSSCGIGQAHCIDRTIVEELCGHGVMTKPDRNQRHGCGCIQSVDIGAYNTCRHGCVYCYANYSEASVERNVRRHDVDGMFLVE